MADRGFTLRLAALDLEQNDEWSGVGWRSSAVGQPNKATLHFFDFWISQLLSISL